ncbi:MAG: amidohydrolase family protein [Maribacter sp.]
MIKKTVWIAGLLIGTLGANAQSLIIKNTNIVDVEAGKILGNRTVLISDGTIKSISRTKVRAQAADNVIDGTDTYLMPGMIDTHIHFFQTGSLYTRPDAMDFRKTRPYEDEIEYAKASLPEVFKRYLRLGVTTVMDVGGPFYNFTIRDSIAKEYDSPNIYLTGPLFSPYQPSEFSALKDAPILKITTKQEATKLFEKMMAYRPDFIKVWYVAGANLPAEKNFELVAHIAKLTHDQNLKILVHATQMHTAELAIKAGADVLVHSVDDQIVSPALIRMLKEHQVAYVPTLLVHSNYHKAFLGQPDNHPHDLSYGDPKVYGTLTDVLGIQQNNTPDRLERFKKSKDVIVHDALKKDSIMASNLKVLLENNIRVATGTDAGNIGTLHASSYLQELEAMQKAGMEPKQIIKASTINAAIAFGLEDEIGSIEKGKKADLLLLKENPMEDLDHLNTIVAVLKDGEVIGISELIKESPEQVVQRQLNAYNARDIDAFMATYADDIKLFDYPDTLTSSDRKKMYEGYRAMFANTPNLYCKVQERIVLGNKVIDKEFVRFGENFLEAIAIYEVIDGKITKVTFIK